MAGTSETAPSMRHVGILAHTVEGAALCFRSLARQGFRELGPNEHPEMTLDCIPLARSMPAYESGDLAAIRDIMAVSAGRLAAAGAEFFICPDNTVHQALDLPGTALSLPGLHVARVVAERARRGGYRRVAVLGTRYLMEGPVYPQALGERGIAAEIPDPPDREVIHEIIFGELLDGVISAGSRARMVAIIETLAGRGCDAVALVCTEIPLLIGPPDSPLPTLDSTRLLAAAAFDVAVGAAPLPQWRGGAA